MTNQITKQFGSYNEKRYSKPWGAIVTFDQNAGIKFSFSGQFMAKDGDPGEVVIMTDSKLVAFGQKDYRGNKTEVEYFYVEDDLTLREISKSEAWNIWKKLQEHNVIIDTSTNPLAGFTVEELQAEIARRAEVLKDE